MQNPETLKRLVRRQWGLDIDYIEDFQALNIMVDEDTSIIPVQTIVKQLSNIRSLAAAENSMGQLTCAVCVLMGKDQLCDSQSVV